MLDLSTEAQAFVIRVGAAMLAAFLEVSFYLYRLSSIICATSTVHRWVLAVFSLFYLQPRYLRSLHLRSHTTTFHVTEYTPFKNGSFGITTWR